MTMENENTAKFIATMQNLMRSLFGTSDPFAEGLAVIAQSRGLQTAQVIPTERGWEKIVEQRSTWPLPHHKIAGIELPDDDHLVERVVKYPPLKGEGPRPRWSHVSAAFSVGSTTGAALCRRFGLDPEEMLGEHEEPEDEEAAY